LLIIYGGESDNRLPSTTRSGDIWIHCQCIEFCQYRITDDSIRILIADCVYGSWLNDIGCAAVI